MSAAFSGKEATANYICAYVRGVLRGGFLHTTSERGEGYIAYKLPKEKMGLKTMWPIACGMLHNSTLKRLLQFGIAIKRGGASLQDRIYDIIFFDWVLLCHSNFFPHFYPELKGVVGPHMFGYNKRTHIRHFVIYIPASAVAAWLCALL